jgi:hypothetical protein
MTMRQSLFVAGAFLVAVCSSVAAADENSVNDKEIQRRIAQLGSLQFHHREEASCALSKLGKPALPSLKKAAKSPDAEVRRRAQRLIESIEAPAVKSNNAGNNHVPPVFKTLL